MKINRTMLSIGLLIIIVLVLAGCSPAPGQVQEAIEQGASTLQAAATELVPTAEAAVAVDEARQESAETAAEHEVSCDLAAVPLPAEGEVTVRFINASGNEMTVIWRDVATSPPALVEYGQVADSETFDQETSAGHEWVLKDHDGNTLEYVATADKQQCVILHHWGYEGDAGPDHWAELRTEYETCAAGRQQSPVDLAGAGLSDLDNIVFEYGETPVKILNNGHTIQVDAIENNRIILSGTPYQLKQFHFHAPSEHLEGGEHYPVEMHLVHQAENGDLAVVGVFIAEGAGNDAFIPVWDHLPAEVTAAVDTGTTVNVADLLPAEHIFYTYSGSLTTPGCKENVKWMVMDNPIQMSAEQIVAFTDIVSGNNRPVQPWLERTVELDESP